MDKSYDLIVSLGGNCSVAMQLSWRNKRPFSLALDWTFMPDEKPVRFLVKAFSDRFANFALKENLEDISDSAPATYTSPIYLDHASGFQLPHQFALRSSNPAWYDRDGPKLRRRVDRIFSEVAARKRVLFILATPFQYDICLVHDLAAAIRVAFPGVDCDLRAMMFDAGKDEELRLEDCEIMKIKRPVHRYDLYQTSALWSFLDDIEVTCCRFPPLKGMNRLCYKIWKSLGKKVKRCGVKTNFVFK